MIKKYKIGLFITGLIVVGLFSTLVLAATTPSILSLQNIAILATTFNHNGGTTTIGGDLGYTGEFGTGPLVVTGTTSSNYSQNGTDQGVLLSTGLNNQSCDFTFGSDTVLSSSTVQAPGVYCITGDMSIGTGGLVLSDSGTYIFRSTGALNTVANSIVSIPSDTSICNIFWTPGAATTLGANSTFIGTDIDDSGITIGSTVNWKGRALSFASTITADTDTITVPSCAIVIPTPTPSHRRRQIIPQEIATTTDIISTSTEIAATSTIATSTVATSTVATSTVATSTKVVATTTPLISVKFPDTGYPDNQFSSFINYNMLSIIAIVLVILWLLGLLVFPVLGGFIHLFLVGAVVVFLVNLIK